IQSALERVSGTLAEVVEDEKLPAQTELDNITANIATLSRDMSSLRLQFDLQNYDADAKLVLLQAKIASAQIKQFLKACFGFAVSVAKAAVAAGLVVPGGAGAKGADKGGEKGGKKDGE